MKTAKYDPYAAAELRPMFVEGMNGTSDHYAVMVQDVEDVWNKVSIVGEGYHLMPNGLCRDIGDDIMSRSRYAWISMKKGHSKKTIFTGKSYADYFMTEDPIVSVKGKEMHAGLMVRNSYDKTASFSLQFFLIMGYCANEMHDRNRFGVYAMRHTNHNFKDWDIQDAIENIERASLSMLEAAPYVGHLQEARLDVNCLCAIKSALALPQGRWGGILDNLTKEEPTEFGLFQAMTNFASHSVAGLGGLVMGEKVGTYFLNRGEHYAGKTTP